MTAARPHMGRRPFRLALAQINPAVGDIGGNVRLIIDSIREAEKKGPDVVVFPELAVTGYPPEDLLLKPRFVGDSEKALARIAPHTKRTAVILGLISRGQNSRLYNSAAIFSGGELTDLYHKIHLPNYGVFDEVRYFSPGNRIPVYEYRGVRLGVTICEDIWFEEGPAKAQAEAGAEIIININASPYHMGKAGQRKKHLYNISRKSQVCIAYLNTVGGQDELVFDGGSIVVDHGGRTLLSAPQFEQGIFLVDVDVGALRKARLRKNRGKPGEDWCRPIKLPSRPSAGKRPRLSRVSSKAMGTYREVYDALVLGTRDYVEKNGFKEVLIALSGGIDSSLVASVAVDALGPARVHGIFLPSCYTSGDSRKDAYGLARNLDISIHEISITPLFEGYLKALKPHFRANKPDTTEENLQARIRGNLVMAMSNKFGWLVLTTGNKSEMSVGYATLYGDMAGGFAVIKDVPKTLVYELCGWRNRKAHRRWIPNNVLKKPPSAELRPDQRDTDSLPPYEVLDPILEAYVEEDCSLDEIIDSGCNRECASKVIRMIDLSEYKRRQAPPGIKITPRAFGRDRRYPITNRYRNY